MPCNERTYSVTKSVWSGGSTSTSVFIPFFEIDAAPFRSARASFRLTPDKALGTDCDVTIRPAYALSNNNEQWPSTVAFGPAASATKGWHYGTAYDTLVSEGRRFLFGVHVLNTSGTAIRGALVELRVELKGDD